ncbi:MAG: DUF4079 family protein [Myxococcota bacterium]
MDPKNPGVLAYAHPALATVTLLLCFVVLRQGLAQRRQRLTKVTAPAGNLKRHSTLGPWAVGLFLASLVGGLGSAVALRGWTPLGTWHGRLALGAAALFGLVWLLGRRLLANDKRLANSHGLLGLVALFLGGIAAMLGISLLP